MNTTMMPFLLFYIIVNRGNEYTTELNDSFTVILSKKLMQNYLSNIF